MNYYLLGKNKKPKGPYPLARLRDLWKAGKISAGTLCCEKGGEKWLPIENVEAITDRPHQVEPPVIGVEVVPPVAANPPPEFVEYESYEPKPTGQWHKRPAVYVFAVLNILYGITYGLAGLGILFQWLSAFDDLDWWGHLVGIVHIYFFGIRNGIGILVAAGGQLFASANPDDKSNHFRENGELAESWGTYFGFHCFLIVIIWLFVSMAIPWPAVIVWAIWVGINFGYHALADSFLENPFRQK